MVIPRRRSNGNPNTGASRKSSSKSRKRAGRSAARSKRILAQGEKKHATQQPSPRKNGREKIPTNKLPETSNPLKKIPRVTLKLPSPQQRNKLSQTEDVGRSQAASNVAPSVLSTTNVHALLESLEHATKAQCSSEQVWREVVEPLIVNLKSVLQLPATSTNLPTIPSLDPFNDTLDVASEARVKDEVLCLNDSLDHLIVIITESASQVAKQRPVRSLRALGNRQYRRAPNRLSGRKESPLFFCLQNEQHTDDTRGFLLDSLLHRKFVDLIFSNLFECNVVGRALDHSQQLEDLWDTVCKRESWSVSQRWRAITSAAASSTLDLNHDLFEDCVTKCCEYIERTLNEAYLTYESRHVFKPVIEEAVPGLRALFRKAHALSMTITQEIITSRLSITTGYSLTDTRALKFNPQAMVSVWADMGATKKDHVLGSYRFGLAQEHENGGTNILVRPAVVTTALLRHLNLSY